MEAQANNLLSPITVPSDDANANAVEPPADAAAAAPAPPPAYDLVLPCTRGTGFQMAEYEPSANPIHMMSYSVR